LRSNSGCGEEISAARTAGRQAAEEEMDGLLLTMTVGSLLLAAAMSAVTWRITARERERSAARVAALASEFYGDDSAPRTFAPEADGATAGLFTDRIEHTPRRLGPGLAIGGAAVAFIVIVLLAFGGRSATSGKEASATEARPIELLSLHHEVKDKDISVTGLVRNPPSNRSLDRLTAVVFLFDDQGGFLASGRAPLDFQSLSPGEESPFVVTLPAPPGVARYRVSFRRNEGGLVSHIDRREARLP